MLSIKFTSRKSVYLNRPVYHAKQLLGTPNNLSLIFSNQYKKKQNIFQ